MSDSLGSLPILMGKEISPHGPAKSFEWAKPAIPVTTEFNFLQNQFNIKHFTILKSLPQFDADTQCSRLAFPELEGLELKALRGQTSETSRIEIMNYCFDLIINHFVGFSSLLSEIKQEYTMMINSFRNIENEKLYLRSKVQKLLGELGKDHIHREALRICNLTHRLNSIRKENQKLSDLILGIELEVINHVTGLYDEEMRSLVDENQRLLLRIKGYLGYIEDWLNRKLQSEPEYGNLLNRVKNEGATLLSHLGLRDGKDESMRSAENAKIKAELEDAKKAFKSKQREMQKLTERLESKEADLATYKSKIEDVQTLNETLRLKLSIFKSDDLSGDPDDGVEFV